MFVRDRLHTPTRSLPLRVETLEGRDVPAIWMNYTGDGQAGNLDNWALDPGEYGENGPRVRFAYFVGESAGGSSDPSYGLQGLFDAISVGPGYDSTVTVTGPILTGWLAQWNGVIDQPLGAGSAITVKQMWWWTGGTLNSTDTPSSLTVDGSLGGWGSSYATIAPTNYGGVATGSTINFLNGTVATFYPGTVDFTGGDGVNITDSSATCQPPVLGAPVAPGSIVFNAERKLITVTNSSFTLNYNLDSGLSLLNVGGTVAVSRGFTAEFKGTVNDIWIPDGYSIGQVSGLIQIDNGATLKAQNGTYLTAGKLATRATVAGTQEDANLIGNLRDVGADVVISDPSLAGAVGPGHQYGKLKVNGNVTWTGGTYRPFIDASQGSERADVWEATGTFTFNGAGAGGAKFGQIVLDLPAGTTVTGRSWEVMRCGAETLQTTLGGQDPGYDVEGVFTLDRANAMRSGRLRGL